MASKGACLVVVKGPRLGDSYQLSDTVILGRTQENDICVPDPAASRQHAKVMNLPIGYVVQDLESRNGTFVNEKQITKMLLKDGDEVRIGSHVFVFSSLQAARAAAPGGVTLVGGGDDKGRSSVKATINVAQHDIADEALKVHTKEENEKLYKRLKVVNSIGKAIGTLLNLTDLLDEIMRQLFDAFPVAKRGFVLLRDEERDSEFVPHAVKHRDGEAEDITISQTIVNEIVGERKAILTADALDDERFQHAMSIVEQSIRSMMCAPLVCSDEVLGLVQLDTSAGRNAFDEDDLALLTSIAAQAAISVKNAQLAREIEHETQYRANLQRYVSPSLAEEISTGRLVPNLGGDRRTGTAFFSDIVGFTEMSEKLAPEEVVTRLNRYFQLMVEVIFRYGGTVDKFGGDAIMAVWGVPIEGENTELNAVRAGLEMQNTLFKFNLSLASAGQRTIRMAIGMNTGPFLAGNIGSDQRMEYTVIGDNVNLASRIEELATRGQIFVSDSTFAAVAPSVAAVRLPPTTVKGKSEHIQVHSVRASMLEDDPHATITSIPVRCMGSSDKNRSGGILVRARSGGDAVPTLTLWTERRPADGELRLVPQTPELPAAPEMQCRVVRTEVVDDPTAGAMAETELAVEEQSPEASSLFSAGSIIESRKRLEETVRA